LQIYARRTHCKTAEALKSSDKPGIVLRSIRSSAPVCSSRKSCSDARAHTCSGTFPSRRLAAVHALSGRVWLCHSSGRSRPPWYSLPMPPRSRFTSVVHCANPQLFLVSTLDIYPDSGITEPTKTVNRLSQPGVPYLPNQAFVRNKAPKPRFCHFRH